MIVAPVPAIETGRSPLALVL